MNILPGINARAFYRLFAVTLMAFCMLCARPEYIGAAETNSPVAQEAMAKGLAAAKQKDYELAIRYFKQSYEAGSDKGQAAFSLALAYDRAGGHEFMAIAWYRIFLMDSIKQDKNNRVVPDERSEQVKQRIIELDIQIESAIRHLIKNTEEAVLSFSGTDRDSYQYIAQAQAAIGDFDSALESLRSAIQSYHDRVYKVQMESKGKQGVIVDDYTTTATFIALSQWKYGDSKGALKTIDWALSQEPYRTPYSTIKYAIFNKWPLEELKMFINRAWKSIIDSSRPAQNEPFGFGGVLWEKMYSNEMDSFLDPGKTDHERRWHDLVRSTFVMYNTPYFVIRFPDMHSYGNISILKDSCWLWRKRTIVSIWPNIANCKSIREFNKSWHEMAKKYKGEYPETTVDKTAILARDMAQVLYFFRKYNDYHSKAYWGYMW